MKTYAIVAEEPKSPAPGEDKQQGQQPCSWHFMLLMSGMLLVFYFLLIRPQQRKAKEHQQFLNNLKKGERVVTNGGLHGRITGLTDAVVTLEIADGVKVKVNRGSIITTAAAAENQAAAPIKGGG